MKKKIALLGTFETKSEELAVLAGMLEAQGLSPVCFDLSLSSDGVILSGEEKIRRMHDIAASSAQKVMAEQPVAVVAIGGGTGSEIAMRAMQPLPVALPKFVITTLPFDPRGAVADNSITLIPTLCDLQGMNSVLRRVFAQTAAMVAGVAHKTIPTEEGRPSVAVSLLGVTQRAGDAVLCQLRAAGHETSAFHAAGYGGAALVRFAAENMFSGMIDLTVNEIVRMRIGGAHTPMPDRYTCLSHRPRIVLPGAMNFFDPGAYDSIPKEYLKRAHYRHSGFFTHVKLSQEEIAKAAYALACDLNQSTAHCEVLIPMGGFSHEDRPGGAIEDPELRETAAKVFETNAKAYTVTRLPHHMDAPEVSTEAVSRLLPLLNIEA